MFVVYKHINPKNGECFYIGSGNEDRPYQLGKYQRGALYKLYCENNDLITQTGLWNGVNVIVEIIEKVDTKEQAIEIEAKLIKENYGKSGYKLVNSQVGFNAFMKQGKIEERSDKVREARSRKVMHVETGVEYNSVTEMALNVRLHRFTLQKRLNKATNNVSYRFGDGITPAYV